MLTVLRELAALQRKNNADNAEVIKLLKELIKVGKGKASGILNVPFGVCGCKRHSCYHLCVQ